MARFETNHAQSFGHVLRVETMKIEAWVKREDGISLTRVWIGAEGGTLRFEDGLIVYVDDKEVSIPLDKPANDG